MWWQIIALSGCDVESEVISVKSNGNLLPESALDLIKEGRNTLAVTSLNNWRWGVYMTTFETDIDNSVYNNGFSVLLDARKKRIR